MPMHDWTRVSAGTFHAFHNAWITHIQEALNGGLLPDPYYALGEQRSGDIGPDVLTLKTSSEDAAADGSGGSDSGDYGNGLVAVAESPPRVRMSQEAGEDIAFYLQRQRTVVVRHATGDRIVGLAEIVSRANRHSLQTLDDFVDKVVAALREGIHVLVIDPFPPSRHDPHGIHGFIWERLMAGDYEAPDGLPLTLVSYCAGHPITAWVEPLATGAELTAMPLFLTGGHYIPLPLEETYCQSWAGVPRRWKRVIEEG